MYGLNAHVWSRRGGLVSPPNFIFGCDPPSPYICNIRERGRGITPHPEIIVIIKITELKEIPLCQGIYIHIPFLKR